MKKDNKMKKTGKLVWLEMNTMRSAIAQQFYTDTFCWSVSPIQVPPWGVLPILSNKEKSFANIFTAMGSFAPSHWLCFISGNVDEAAAKGKEFGLDTGGIQELGEWARIACMSDAKGNDFFVIEIQDGDPEDPVLNGSPYVCELWTKDPQEVVPFYESLFDLKAKKTDRGWSLYDTEDELRLLVRKQLHEDGVFPGWIPYFRSCSVGGDRRRAEQNGAIENIYQETCPVIGDISILSDPAGGFFGLLNPKDKE